MIKNIRYSIFLALVLLPVILFSQEINRKIIDPRLDKEILYGYCDRNGLEKGEFGKLFDEFYQRYEPDKAVLDKLKLKQEGVEILIVLGTWCSDSQEQVPRFFKILDKIKFNKKSLQMICVSRDKEAGEVETVNYNIQKVPTFIVYRKGREIGRIIESPYATLEKDLLMFFSDN
jgi:thiol-disulfide isomerase/thioredoxin